MVAVTLAMMVGCGPPQLSNEQAEELLREAAAQKAHTIHVPVGEVAFVHMPDSGLDIPAAGIMSFARNLRDENDYLEFAACTEIRSGFHRIRANRQCSISLTDVGEIAFGMVPEVTIDPSIYLVEAQYWLEPTLATAEIAGITGINTNEAGAEISFQWSWNRTEFGEATSVWDGLDTKSESEGRAYFSFVEGGWHVDEINW
jgi:hypothetical protein